MKTEFCFKSCMKQFVALCCLSVIIGNLSIFLFPVYFNVDTVGHNVESKEIEIPRISISNISSKYTQNILFVDARNKQSLEVLNVEDAVSIPIDDYDKAIAKSLNKLISANGIIVYCDNTRCSASNFIAQKLYELGFRNVFILNDDFKKINTKNAISDENTNI